MATRPELLTTEQKPPFFFLSELTHERKKESIWSSSVRNGDGAVAHQA